MNVEGKASLLRKIASRSFKKSDTKEPAAYLPLRKRARMKWWMDISTCHMR
ncbi:hypothetical protein DSO57_1038808 [Entomophthora muscae]|uniref:Uncharacterized protein n=1 Tax=Entomophthora muscae TaxID=34485 RepID=A0ACC2U7L5_9FUNG|nr:hypothetical protein DSO57_1038808 [Entomophthora muscae]